MDQLPHEDAGEPDFARGQDEGQPSGGEQGRFSEGQEDLPDTPDKEREGSFADGQAGEDA